MTAGTAGGSTGAESLRPGCGTAGGPRSRRPGSERIAEIGARWERSRSVRLHGPAGQTDRERERDGRKVCVKTGARSQDAPSQLKSD